MATNWIEGRNPYKLSQPSPWWLQLLFDYDPLLVVMPSVKDCAYRLCRRVPRHGQLGRLVTHLHTHPDTVQMINHGLVPVSTLTTWATRSDKIIRDLMACDTSRVGGAEKASDMLEARERRAADRQDRQLATDLDHVSGEAFRSLQFRNGSAIAVTRPARPSAAHKSVDKRDHRSVSSPAITVPARPSFAPIILTD
jgi:hypothetical protein